MKSFIRRVFSYSVLALIAAVLLLPLSGAAYARCPKAGHYTIYGETVGADSGEDPLLKVDSQVDSWLIRDFDRGIFSTTADGVDTAIMGGNRTTGCKVGSG